MLTLFSFQVKAALSSVLIHIQQLIQKNQFTLCINHNLMQKESKFQKTPTILCLIFGPLLCSYVALDKFISSINCLFLYKFLDDTYLWVYSSTFS